MSDQQFHVAFTIGEKQLGKALVAINQCKIDGLSVVLMDQIQDKKERKRTDIPATPNERKLLKGFEGFVNCSPIEAVKAAGWKGPYASQVSALMGKGYIEKVGYGQYKRTEKK